MKIPWRLVYTRVFLLQEIEWDQHHLWNFSWHMQASLQEDWLQMADTSRTSIKIPPSLRPVSGERGTDPDKGVVSGRHRQHYTPCPCKNWADDGRAGKYIPEGVSPRGYHKKFHWSLSSRRFSAVAHVYTLLVTLLYWNCRSRIWWHLICLHP